MQTLGEKSERPPSPQISWTWWYLCIISVIQEASVGGPWLQVGPEQRPDLNND
jgi:hypothetical protein